MSDLDFREVLDSLDMELYLDREGITYKRAHGSRGPQLNLQTCPVCGGNKWKVFLNAESGLGNCFSGSCEAKFNKFSFIKASSGLEGRKLVELVKLLAAEQGWRPARKHSVEVHNTVGELKLPSSHAIPINGKNLIYLENRGISKDVAQYFNLRFCQKGLFRYQVEERVLYMPFDNRIIIPIYDLDGTLVSFQGRDITGAAEKKYLFPPGFASTGSHLYNGHNVVNTKRVVVGEGVFDVMAIKIAMDEEPELRDVVPIGTFGKHLSNAPGKDDQMAKMLRLKERGVEEVTMMWDGEIAALDDACEAGGLLKSVGFKVRIALLPNDKDPNEVSSIEVRRAFYEAPFLDHGTEIRLRMKRRASG